MAINRILAISSSRVGDSGYLEAAAQLTKTFLGDNPLKIAFIPFASVNADYGEYGKKVKDGLRTLPYLINTVKPETAVADIVQADVMMVGGGNTFKLLHDIYYLGLLDVIRDKINSGIPYIGWSAGANITGPTLCTTNDMPIIQPKVSTL
jgi:dipeptidase E